MCALSKKFFVEKQRLQEIFLLTNSFSRVINSPRWLLMTRSKAQAEFYVDYFVNKTFGITLAEHSLSSYESRCTSAIRI
jgi:hypothetical protein